MSQSNNNQSGNTDEDKRLKSLGYSFSAISFLVFIYVLLFPVEKELKQQAIYWFASSFVSAIIPNVKQFKIKDIEVQLQGISQKIEENKNLIEQKNEELRDDLFLSLESVRKNEESLSEDYREKREQGYRRYANKLEKLTPEKRLREQNKFTIINLIDIGMSLSDLKRMLQKAGFYKGEIDEIFNEELAKSIGAFQQKHGVLPVDGTAGPKTLSKLSEVIGTL
ncbi:MAG: peptidoglycan-binding domain-containing protein [Microcystis panniformis]